MFILLSILTFKWDYEIKGYEWWGNKTIHRPEEVYRAPGFEFPGSATDTFLSDS